MHMQQLSEKKRKINAAIFKRQRFDQKRKIITTTRFQISRKQIYL